MAGKKLFMFRVDPAMPGAVELPAPRSFCQKKRVIPAETTPEYRSVLCSNAFQFKNDEI
jgi:hypothetical protein